MQIEEMNFIILFFNERTLFSLQILQEIGDTYKAFTVTINLLQ